jgi:hypothetical protein
VDPTAGVDGWGKSRLRRDSIPGPSRLYQVAIPTELSRPTKHANKRFLKVVEQVEYYSPNGLVTQAYVTQLLVPLLATGTGAITDVSGRKFRGLIQHFCHAGFQIEGSVSPVQTPIWRTTFCQLCVPAYSSYLPVAPIHAGPLHYSQPEYAQRHDAKGHNTNVTSFSL